MKECGPGVWRGKSTRAPGTHEMVSGGAGSIPLAARKSRFGGLRLRLRDRALALTDLAAEQIAKKR